MSDKYKIQVKAIKLNSSDIAHYLNSEQLKNYLLKRAITVQLAVEAEMPVNEVSIRKVSSTEPRAAADILVEGMTSDDFKASTLQTALASVATPSKRRKK